LSLPDAPAFEEWQLQWRERLHHQATDVLGALACGCAGYLAKPITRSALVQSVLRQVPAVAVPNVTYLPGKASAQDAAGGLRDAYRESRLRDARMIPALLAADDLYRIERLASMMQRTGDGYGLGVVSAIGARLEQAVSDGNRDAIGAVAKELERALLAEPGLTAS
jgi:hypothetical protein